MYRLLFILFLFSGCSNSLTIVHRQKIGSLVFSSDEYALSLRRRVPQKQLQNVGELKANMTNIVCDQNKNTWHCHSMELRSQKLRIDYARPVCEGVTGPDDSHVYRETCYLKYTLKRMGSLLDLVIATSLIIGIISLVFWLVKNAPERPDGHVILITSDTGGEMDFDYNDGGIDVD